MKPKCSRRTRPVRAVVLALLWMIPAGAHADEWVLTTADLRTERVTLRALDERGVAVVGTDGRARVVGFDRMLQLDRAAAPAAAGGRFLLILDSGERLAGQPRGLEGELLVWDSPALGELKVPLQRVVAMSRPNAPRPASDRRIVEDVITLTNNDTVRGIISTVGESAITIQAGALGSMDVPLDSIASIQFAPVAGVADDPVSAARACRVAIIDSTVIVAPAVEVAGDRLSMTLADGTERSIALTAVSGIEQINGPLVWLSSRRPTENIQTPFLDLSAPARMDESVTGSPIRFGDRTFARGIGVHSYSRMTWNIEPGHAAFRTQYAIDGQLPHANVTVRILLDDRVVHEREDFVAGVLSPLIVLDTAGARTITLEVDYGETYDVQDRFNWIEPALLRSKPPPPPAPPAPPATAPATRPATLPDL